MCLAEYYEEIRTALFLSGMTLGTFIFTMKSFMIQIMKKEVYDKKSYQEKIKQFKSTGKDIECYKPLKQLSRSLLAAITLSFLSASLHITIGLSDNTSMIALCLGITVISWISVGTAITLVSLNLRKMINISEEEFKGQ